MDLDDFIIAVFCVIDEAVPQEGCSLRYLKYKPSPTVVMLGTESTRSCPHARGGDAVHAG